MLPAEPARVARGSWCPGFAWHLPDKRIFVFVGVPEAEVTWFRNKSKLGSSHHLHEGSLLLINVSFSDQGLYSCRAANLHGELTEGTQLLILGKNRSNPWPQVDCVWWLTHPPPAFSPLLNEEHKIDWISFHSLLPQSALPTGNTECEASQSWGWNLALPR